MSRRKPPFRVPDVRPLAQSSGSPNLRPDAIQRRQTVIDMRLAGETYAAIGRVLGITRERVRQMWGTEQRYEIWRLRNAGLPVIAGEWYCHHWDAERVAEWNANL